MDTTVSERDGSAPRSAISKEHPRLDRPLAGADPKDRQLGFFEVLKSVLAAFFGVQSNRNRERDFTGGKPSHFIVIGILATAMFVLIVWGLVQLLLRSVT